MNQYVVAWFVGVYSMGLGGGCGLGVYFVQPNEIPLNSIGPGTWVRTSNPPSSATPPSSTPTHATHNKK